MKRSPMMPAVLVVLCLPLCWSCGSSTQSTADAADVPGDKEVADVLGEAEAVEPPDVPDEVSPPDLGTDKVDLVEVAEMPDVPLDADAHEAETVAPDEHEQEDACAPDCEDRTCGDDGCGGTCGTCDDGYFCRFDDSASACAPECGTACQLEGLECGEPQEWPPETWGDELCDCGACEAGTLCQDGTCVCLGDCAGKECGGDGCGGSCGECGMDMNCQQGTCVEGSALGKACDQTADCGGDTTCLLGFCSRVCRMDGEAIPGACSDVSEFSTWGQDFACPADFDFCLPAAVAGQAATCAGNADCPIEALCAGLFPAGDGKASGVCLPASGKAAGEGCATANECASRLCLHPGQNPATDGTCSLFCGTDAECPQGTLCAMVPLTLEDEVLGWAALCQPFGGSLAPCASTADCKFGKETCTAIIGPDGGPTMPRCLATANPEGLWLGATCKKASDCFEPYCIFETWSSNVDAYCTRTCASDADCSPETACRKVHVSPFAGIGPEGPFELSVCLKVADGSLCFVGEQGGCEQDWSTCAPIPGGVAWIGTCKTGSCPPDCAGKTCRAADGCGGLCLDACLENGAACADGPECLSEICLEGTCCSTGCAGKCMSCTLTESPGECLPIPAGQDPDGECGPCHRCDGMGGCAPLPAGPEPFGLCGPCKLCDDAGTCVPAAAMTDAMDDCGPCLLCDGEGACGPVPQGLDPKEDCLASDPGTCLYEGSCDGVGACAFWPAATPCGEASCAGGFAMPVPHCDGAGKCVKEPPVACSPYLCTASGSACGTSCVSHAECAAGAWCQGQTCQALPKCPQLMKLNCNTKVPTSTAASANQWSAYAACAPGTPFEGGEKVFSFKHTVSTRVTVTLSDQQHDAALAVLDSGCEPDLACVATTNTGGAGQTEQLTFLAQPQVQYYVVAEGVGGADAGALTLSADCCTTKCAGKNACGDDGCGGSCGECGTEALCVSGQCAACDGPATGEPNDECGKALPLEEGTVSGLLCPTGDQDWFTVTVEEGDKLLLLLDIDQPATLGMTLLAADCSAVLAASTQTPSGQELEHQFTSAGTYFVRIDSPAGSTATYELTAEMAQAQCVSTGNCTDGKVCVGYVCIVPPPPCETLASLACGESVNGDTTAAASALEDFGSCTDTKLAGPEALYAVSPTEDVVVTLTLSGLPTGAIALLEEYCASQWACVGVGLEGMGVGPMLTAKLTAGQDYFVVVDGLTGEDKGAFALDVDCCTPSCEGKACGDDGCGMGCGECPGPQDACVANQCVCQPDCAGRQCGDDGCGGSCGTCGNPQSECKGGLCICTPECAGKACGDDGCGGSCGTCTGPQDGCIANQCVCQSSCAGKQCGDDGCGGSCGACTGPQDACIANQCICQPDCAGKVCGPDGCGGSCGACLGPQDKCAAGFCVCQPACSGKACGPDGCGATCGTCVPAKTCSANQCICLSDPNEPNNACGQAKGLTPGSYENMVLCPVGDEDWYAVQLSAGQKLTFKALFKSKDGDLDLFLYDKSACSSYLKSSTSSGDNETILFTAAQTGTYAVRVLEFGGKAETKYSIAVTIE